MPHRLTNQTIDDEGTLRALFGDAIPLVKAKVDTRLTPLTRQFVENSPFLCLATTNRDGRCDVSPRGDPRGFVRILDEATLLIPERPGNRLMDSLSNILETPRVGLLFFIPGLTDTFRVNGHATLTTDAALLAPCEVESKVPRVGILVDIDEAFTHCSKAFLRSHFWDPAHHITDRATLPSNGQILKERHGDSFDAEAHDAERAERYKHREGFY